MWYDKAMVAKTDKKQKQTGRGEGAIKMISKNRRATYDYAVEEKFEAGIVLVGSEVKSLRGGKCEMVDSFGQIERGEAWLKQMYIPPFEQARAFPHEPRRNRKLLLNVKEIERIAKAVDREGYTLIPMEVYFKGSHVKILLGLARGKKTHDKRHDIAKKTADREARADIVRARKQ